MSNAYCSHLANGCNCATLYLVAFLFLYFTVLTSIVNLRMTTFFIKTNDDDDDSSSMSANI